MTDTPDANRDLTAREIALAEQLQVERPVPPAGFRGALSRHLVVHDPGYGTRPEHLRVTVTGYLTAGGLLLALGGLQVFGLL